MKLAAMHNADHALDGNKGPSNAFRKWIKLVFYLFVVYLFMFVVAPFVEQSPLVKPLAQFIEDTGIDASALYYTELDETSEAEIYLHDMSTYSPVSKK